MIASSGPASSTSQPWAPSPCASWSTFSATPPSGGSKASRTLGMLAGLGGAPRGAEERAQLGLGLAAPPAADGVDGEHAGLDGLLGVAGQAALRRGDEVGAGDAVSRGDDPQREPQVLADQRPPRRVAAQMPA